MRSRLDLALLLEEKELVEVALRAHEADVLGGHRPAVERGLAVEAPVRAVVVLALDPGPQPAIERVEASSVGVGERRQQLHAYRPKPALLLSLALGLVRPGVDQRDAELGADQREVVRAIGGAVVDVEPLGHPAAQDRLLQHRQEGRGVLGEREGGVGHDPRGVVEKRR